MNNQSESIKISIDQFTVRLHRMNIGLIQIKTNSLAYMVPYKVSYTELTFSSKRQWVPRRPPKLHFWGWEGGGPKNLDQVSAAALHSTIGLLIDIYAS